MYPWLAWLLSLGHPSAAAWGLVLTNVVVIGLLGALAAYAIRSTTHRMGTALTVLLVPGLVGALSRDLTEATTALAVVAGVVAYREKHWVLAGAAFSAAVLARETALLIPLVYGVLALIEIARRERRPGVRELVWITPFVIFAAWQLGAHYLVGSFPIFSSTNSGDLGVPFVGFARSLTHWFEPFSFKQLVKGCLYIVQTIAAVSVVALALRRRTWRSPEMWCLILFSLLVICETRQGWLIPFDSRYATVPMALAWFSLLDGSRTKDRRTATWIALPVVAATVMWRIIVV